MPDLTYQKRYLVALAKPNEPNCYVHLSETDKESEAKRIADETAAKEGRECVVMDSRECPPITYRAGQKSVPAPPPPAEKKKKK